MDILTEINNAKREFINMIGKEPINLVIWEGYIKTFINGLAINEPDKLIFYERKNTIAGMNVISTPKQVIEVF